jgi:hypothetical protein
MADERSAEERRLLAIADAATATVTGEPYPPPPGMTPQQRDYAARRAREDRYCRAHAADFAMSTSSGSDLVIGALLGRRLNEDRFYHDCLAHFSRVRILSE